MPDQDLLDLVNPLCGSDSERAFSTGNTYPAVGVPWGMTYFSPRNRKGGWVFSRRRGWPVNQLDGFTATHAPSPWMGDYCSFTVLPGLGLVSDPYDARATSYRLSDEVSRPELYACRFTSPDLLCELTATARVGLLRVTYDRGGDGNVTVQLSGTTCTVEQSSEHEIIGIAKDGKGLTPDFGCRFVIRFDRPIKSTRFIGGKPTDGSALAVHFDVADGQAVPVTMATSFISHDQARLNMEREVGRRSFDDVRDQTADAWRAELNRVRVTGGDMQQRRTFYTCLWRTLLFPRTLTEFNPQGDAVHFSPYTDRVEPGTLVTDNGFWDTSRTVYPLLSLVWRKRLGEMLHAWLNAYRENGWMPQWASPGQRSCMVGTHSAAVFCDAILKGISGFSHEDAFNSMLQDATKPGDPEGKWGRQQLAEYHKLGYCPQTTDIDSVCRTLDYSYNDWCVWKVAEALGKSEHLDTFKQRAGNWRNVFEPSEKFFHPRHADGTWQTPFKPFDWGGPYREGSAYQYRFALLHDAEGLAECFGGPAVLAKEIQQLAEMPARFDTGEYGLQVHEMVELAAVNFGQYAHSNQPVHGVLWLPARLGHPEVTDTLVRRVLSELYSPDAYCGDEDNGEMSAWYILAAIGLGAHCPGEPSYTPTVPLFESIELHGDDGHVIRINRSDGATRRRTIDHAELMHAAGPISLP